MPKSDVKIVDRGWDKIKKQAVKAVPGIVSSVGWQAPKGDQIEAEHNGLTNVQIGAWVEFGTSGMAPWFPLRNTFDVHKSDYEKELVSISKAFFGGAKIEGQIRVLGEKYRGDIIKAVKNKQLRNWKDSTAEAKAAEGKGGDPPLWNSSQLINSINVLVVKATERK